MDFTADHWFALILLNLWMIFLRLGTLINEIKKLRVQTFAIKNRLIVNNQKGTSL